MADARRGALPRVVVTLGAIAATLAGWLGLAAQEAAAPRADGEALLPPMPTLQPTRIDAPPRAARRPAPIATTRSSR